MNWLYGGADELRENRLQNQLMLTLKKASFEPIPEIERDLIRLAEIGWADFSAYANDSQTLNDEKTHAFCNSHQAAARQGNGMANAVVLRTPM